MRSVRPFRATLRPKVAFAFVSSLASFSLALLLVLELGSAAPVAAQDDPVSRRAAAEGQFERAEALRATLEAKTERERSLREYEELVTAYRRVYLITPSAVQVPPAIKTVADLYRRMGEQFEPKYFELAIKTYEYLIRDYPESSLREGALIAIAEIRKNNLSQPELAQENYEDFLRQYPRSTLAPQARKALAQIQGDKIQTDKVQKAKDSAKAPEQPDATPAARSSASTPSGSVAGGAPAAGAAPGGAPAGSAAAGNALPGSTAPPGQNSEVSHVRIWNAENYTRIIIELGGQAKYQAARIFDPDRIYFDIENAKLSNELLHQPIDVPSGGYLKAVRVAQNRSDVVRVVLDVAKVKDYSVFELADPDRLVVDVYGPADGAGAVAAANSAAKENPKTNGKPAAPATVASGPSILLPAPLASPASTPKTARIEAPRAPSLGLLPLSAKASSSLLSPPALPKSAAAATPPSESLKTLADNIGPAPAAKPTRSGERSLTRALGLKIGRIVIDPGHGGHDTGTIGPTGLMEKDLCLDVALRLGKLIEKNLPSAEIVYTRQDDRYVGLERRTAIANEAKADLFISVHGNSSDDTKVSGIETYYLNFNASAPAMEVAARENATAQSSVHDLQDLVTKIARNEKIEESRDLAADIQESLAASMQIGNRPERNRGVRKAPFVVLVGADMPSVLAEISFISNPADEQWLKKPENRQRSADGLYRGIEKYLRGVNSLTTTISPSANLPRSQ
jgi:N-acetylmuramoyl-L-alanine amidase